ncbi:hypothetical protein [Amycolatopsis magusensis]|uniref:D-alanyl-D-alanine carboxypeptidase n=1 Tax=Amycolatopsis magusensis TaxID=882444 RepID=A0ABS4Q3K1_9PSEU|nr:hypothetical protein [Amycolatopsis magusensis]MBP2186163.1 hypothetical protein [Amycolatopsis magusensis]MDI5982651.1 hypothetical protein [Amycolatopsis magusensis]
MRKFLVRSLVAGAIASLGVLAGSGMAAAEVAGADPVFDQPDAGAVPEMGALVTKLTHSQATSRLSSSNISWSSSGGCSDRNKPNCTSFDQVNLASIQGAQTLKSASGCGLNVTGGTETGHASGTYSHWNGYKLDFSLSSCLTNYIKGNFSSIGGNKWKAGSGNIYYLESNHWDVTFYNCGGC